MQAEVRSMKGAVSTALFHIIEEIRRTDDFPISKSTDIDAFRRPVPMPYYSVP